MHIPIITYIHLALSQRLTDYHNLIIILHFRSREISDVADD